MTLIKEYILSIKKYTKEVLEEGVSKSSNYGDLARYFGVTPFGGTRSYLKQRVKFFEIDDSHFTGQAWSKGKILDNKRKSPDQILVVLPDGSNRAHARMLKRALLESGVDYVCSICGMEPVWNGEELDLEIDHIDGNYLDCRKDNLRFTCPNCHAQTGTYKNRRRG